MGFQVINSDDHISDWDKEKIISSLLYESSLASQFHKNEPLDQETALGIAKEVEKHINKLEIDQVSGSLIREVTNTILLKKGYEDLARFTRRVGLPVSDAFNIDVGGGKGDNANLIRQPETFHKRKADTLAKEQALAMMPKDLAKLHLNADLHIHDLEYATARQFCLDTDIRYIFYYGLLVDGTGDHTSVAKPAKHADVATLHIMKALAASQGSCAGGQGCMNFLAFMAPYYRGLTKYEIRQQVQLLIFELTQMFISRGGQSIFSSLQLTPGVPDIWLDVPVVHAGKIYDGKQNPLKTYKDYEKEVRLGFECMMDVLMEGDARGKSFNFPKPEIAIQKEFMQERDWFNAEAEGCLTYELLYLKAFELTAKFGTPYFDNILPKYRQTGGIDCVQCCAYAFQSNSDTDNMFEKKMNFTDGHHFSMGSEQVMTVNFPRLAFQSADVNEFIERGKLLLDECVRVFLIKNSWMRNIRATNGVPFLSQTPPDWNEPTKNAPPLVDFDALVFTIGVIGLNEVVQYFTGQQLHESNEAVKTAMKIALSFKKYCQGLSKKNKITIAFARTPAETTGQRFAVADLRDPRYKEAAMKVVKGNLDYALSHLSEKDLPVYYTNGTMVTPSARVSLQEKIRIEEKFFPILDGGNIAHLWLDEASPDPKGLMDLTMKICSTTNLGYFSFTRDLTICRGTYKKYSS